MRKPAGGLSVCLAAATIVLLSWLRIPATADVRNCACDVTKPETLTSRECSLCEEAEKQPADVSFFFLKDKNPTKPNRLLILPRRHAEGSHALEALTADQRTALWTAAIDKGRELWGNNWGVAYNGEERRTQCHTHLHIGKLLDGQENDRFIVVDGPAQIPLPGDAGMWVHPVNGKLHVHAGDQVTEFVLMR